MESWSGMPLNWPEVHGVDAPQHYSLQKNITEMDSSWLFRKTYSYTTVHSKTLDTSEWLFAVVSLQGYTAIFELYDWPMVW